MKVELVAKTVGKGKYKDLNSEEIIAAIARHGTIKKDNGRLVKYLMDEKHWSPLDMINFVFEVETSRSIGRQIIRHWAIKPQEHSQRYSKSSNFQPIELRKEHPTNRQSSTEVFNPIVKGNFDTIQEDILASELINNLLKRIEEAYEGLLEAGVAKECAREILPECTTTVLSLNGSLRSWLSFLNVRMDHHSQKEIQIIAKQIGESLEKDMPNVFSTIDWRKGMFM